MIRTLVGELTADEFLADYWQKRPLLVRGAAPGFTCVTGVSGRDDMLALAARDNVESRVVSQAGGWSLDHHPFQSDVAQAPRQVRDRPGAKRQSGLP